MISEYYVVIRIKQILTIHKRGDIIAMGVRMRVRHHGDLENMFMYLAELEGSFDLWDDPFGGPPEPTPLQWRIDQMKIIENVPNWIYVDHYFKCRWALGSAKIQYAITSDQLSEFNLGVSDRTKLRLKAKEIQGNIKNLNSFLHAIEKDSRFKNAINKISELRHQGKLLKFTEWMRT